MTRDDTEAIYLSAARRALAEFPVRAESLELFSVSENITFRLLDGRTGELHALRLHRPGYNTLAELESQRHWTAALGAAGIVVQTGLRTSEGAHFCELTIPELGEARYAGLTRWVPGTPLSEYIEQVDRSAGEFNARRAFRQIGSLAAQMHWQSASWQAPSSFTRPRLDAPGLLGDAPRWGRFWEHPDLDDAQRALLEKSRALLKIRLQAYCMTRENFGLIHADLHPDNLVRHEDQLSVIDFDDAAYGWYVYDLATALMEYWGSARFPTLREALLLGYRESRPLAERDERMLNTFLLLRGMALIGWFADRPEHASSEYFSLISDRVLEACAELIDHQATVA